MLGSLINPIISPKPVFSHTSYTWRYLRNQESQSQSICLMKKFRLDANLTGWIWRDLSWVGFILVLSFHIRLSLPRGPFCWSLPTKSLYAFVVCDEETLIPIYQTKRHHISEDRHLNSYHCENLKSHIRLISTWMPKWMPFGNVQWLYVNGRV